MAVAACVDPPSTRTLGAVGLIRFFGHRAKRDERSTPVRRGTQAAVCREEEPGGPSRMSAAPVKLGVAFEVWPLLRPALHGRANLDETLP